MKTATGSTKKSYFIFLLLPLLLSSCAGRQISTQPPAGYSRTQKQKTSQKPYSVNGKRYAPLASHEGFEQEGIASSYGRDFHGRKTSSGEPFDMNAMTAAHKTLPLGVFVLVRHKRSNREVIVRINDRGPFVRDRIVDLSEAAAGKLGMLQEGLAAVRVTALGYKSGTGSEVLPYKQPVSYDSGSYALQVGAFSIRDNAYRHAGDLRQKYGSAEVQEAIVTGKKYYRVRMGRFTSLKAAQTDQQRYERTLFPGCFVVAVD